MNILVFRIFRRIKFYMQIPMGLDTADKNFSTIILFLPCDYFMELKFTWITFNALLIIFFKIKNGLCGLKKF